MTLAELRSALAARGFNHLSTTEQNDFINYSYLVDICDADEWPFLQGAAATGTAPLTISDLGTIESVRDVTNSRKLTPLDRQSLSDYEDDLTTTGTPENYYTTGGDTVNVYPVQATSLSVLYWKAPAALSADSDEPIFPERYHRLIVDAAVRRAYEAGDEYDAAEAARQIFEGADGYGGRIQRMREALLNPQHDRPNDFVILPRYAQLD